MAKHFFNFLKESCAAVPLAFAGQYDRGNTLYKTYVNRYYPKNRVIHIGSFHNDLISYLSDYGAAFYTYKRNTTRCLVDHNGLHIVRHGEATSKATR